MKVTILLALVVGMIFGVAINKATTEDASAEVYAVCNSARLEISGDSEQRCGDLQDKYNIEFLCEARNSLPKNDCWVEVK